MKNFVFKKMSYIEGYKILQNNMNKTWLIRESTKDGMLTVDFDNRRIKFYENGIYCSLRLALMPDGWKFIDYSEVEETQKTMQHITKANCDTYLSSLRRVLREIGFNTDNILLPEINQISRNEKYGDYALSKDLNNMKISEDASNRDSTYAFFSEREDKPILPINIDQIYNR